LAPAHWFGKRLKNNLIRHFRESGLEKARFFCVKDKFKRTSLFLSLENEYEISGNSIDGFVFIGVGGTS
jgi:hypothetical protein